MRVKRFATVGVLNTVIDFLLFGILTIGLGVQVALANTISYSAGIANSYAWNRNWTFSDRRSDRWAGESLKFVLANLGGLGVNTAIVWLAVAGYGASSRAGLVDLPGAVVLPCAKALALVGSTVFNYIAFHSWVFVDERRE